METSETATAHSAPKESMCVDKRILTAGAKIISFSELILSKLRTSQYPFSDFEKLTSMLNIINGMCHLDLTYVDYIEKFMIQLNELIFLSRSCTEDRWKNFFIPLQRELEILVPERSCFEDFETLRIADRHFLIFSESVFFVCGELLIVFKKKDSYPLPR